MKIRIKAVRYKGNISSERLVLQVLADADIGAYAVFKTEVSQGSVSNEIKASYWFPDKLVEAGDLVVLCTKEGVDKEKLNESGSTTHFFYWGKTKPVWNVDNRAAVLLRIAEWDYKLLPSSE
jgi:hypothetical protein